MAEFHPLVAQAKNGDLADFPPQLERQLRVFFEGESVEIPDGVRASDLFRRSPGGDVVPSAESVAIPSDVVDKLLTSDDTKELREGLETYYGGKLRNALLGTSPAAPDESTPPPEPTAESLRTGTVSTDATDLDADPIVSTNAIGAEATASLETSRQTTRVGDDRTTQVTEEASATASVQGGLNPSEGFSSFIEGEVKVGAETTYTEWSGRVTDPEVPPSFTATAGMQANAGVGANRDGNTFKAGVAGNGEVEWQPRPETTLGANANAGLDYTDSPEGEVTTFKAGLRGNLEQALTPETLVTAEASRTYTSTNNADPQTPDSQKTVDRVSAEINYTEPEDDPNQTTAGLGATWTNRDTGNPETSGDTTEVGGRFSQQFGEEGGKLTLEANPLGSEDRTVFKVGYENKGDSPPTSGEIRAFRAGLPEQLDSAVESYNDFRLVSALPPDVRNVQIPDYVQAEGLVQESLGLIYKNAEAATERFKEIARQDPEVALNAIGTDALSERRSTVLSSAALQQVRQGASALIETQTVLEERVTDAVDRLQEAPPSQLGLGDALNPTKLQLQTVPTPKQQATPQQGSTARTTEPPTTALVR